MKIRASLTVLGLASLLCTGASLAQAPAGLTEGNPPMSQNLRNALAPPPPLPPLVIAPAGNEWLTWGYDQERTGWNRAETMLSPRNVGKLKPLWSTQLAITFDKYVLSTATSPIVVSGVATPAGPVDMLFILGANDTLFALDASSGKPLWSKSFPNPHKSTAPVRDWLCPKTVNSTPTIDKARGIVFFLTGDGMLRGLNMADGAERLAPVAMTAPFARAWSLNLIDNVLYSPSGRACGEITDKSSLEYSAAMSGLRRA
jgi:glucose dehydrogenase